MDKAQASAVADALLQNARRTQPSTRGQDLYRPWSRWEWTFAILSAFQSVVAGAGIAAAFNVPFGGIIFVAELCGPVGLLIGYSVITCHRILVRKGR